MEEEAIERAAEAIASTPLEGCMDDEGLSVYIRHLWPEGIDSEHMSRTLHRMARAAVGAYQSNRQER